MIPFSLYEPLINFPGVEGRGRDAGKMDDVGLKDKDGGSLEKTCPSKTLPDDSPAGMGAQISQNQGCVWLWGGFIHVECQLSPLKGGCILFC